MRQWFDVSHQTTSRVFQTVTRELDFIFFKLQKIKKYKEIIIWKFFERNFARNCVKNGFFLQNNSVENSLICPRAKSSNHCLTELFSIYQNKHWTIRRRDDHIVVPSSNRIKSKIDWILETIHSRRLYFLRGGVSPLPTFAYSRGVGKNTAD